MKLYLLKPESNRNLFKISRILLIMQFLMAAAGCIIGIQCDLYAIETRFAIVVAMDILSNILVFLMSFSIRNSFSTDQKLRSILFLMLFVNSSYLLIDEILWIIDGIPELIIWNKHLNTLFFIESLITTCLFWIFLCSLLNCYYRRISQIIMVFAALDFIYILANNWNGYVFQILEDGRYVPGPYYLGTVAVPFGILIVSLIVTILSNLKLSEKLIVMLYPIAPLVDAVITGNSDTPTLLSIEIFVSGFIIYCTLYLRREQEQILSQKQLAEQQKELKDSRINLMRQQMNPHFIYNTLGTIAALCQENPEEAEQLTVQFSDYLRSGFTELADKLMLPFQTEIDHLQHYLRIENVRFPDLTVTMDLQVTDFEIPCMTLQPMVENAIRHGIRGKQSGGHIHITSMKIWNEYVIRIMDDGIGYSGIPEDGRKHVGLTNVSFRLEQLCGGSLTIEGKENVGTTVEIRLPVQQKTDAADDGSIN